MRGEAKSNIINTLLRNKHEQLSKYKIAKLAGCSYSWVHEYLDELEAKRILKGTKVIDEAALKGQLALGEKKERANMPILIILAAGVGSRSLPLTKDIPKCLMKVGGKTLLERMIGQNYASSLTSVLVVVGHKNELVEEELARLKKTYRKLKAKTLFNSDYLTTNNIYSLWLARESAKNGFILVDGDVIVDDAIIRKVNESNIPNLLLIDEDKAPEEEDVKVLMDSSGIYGIGKHIELNKSNGISVGIAKFSREGAKVLFDEVKKKLDEGKRNIFYEEAFEAMTSKIRIDTITTGSAHWREIDFLSEYEDAKKVFRYDQR